MLATAERDSRPGTARRGIRPRTDRRSGARRRTGVRAACHTGLPPDAGRARIRRRHRRHADALPQGELLQRLHLHRGRALPLGAVLPVLQPATAGGAAQAGDGVRRAAALEVALCAARSRHLSARQRPGLRRRRAHRRGPDAGGGERQPADPGRPRWSAKLGNSDFARQYWPQFTQWAEYLREKGLDPANQLSTDDFAGSPGAQCEPFHQGHRGPGRLCARWPAGWASPTWRKSTRSWRRTWPRKWQTMAMDGDHYKLAFDKPGTWSQKYNLVWDQILGLNLFPQRCAKPRSLSICKHLNQFGLPLDNRATYTKLDWETVDGYPGRAVPRTGTR